MSEENVVNDGTSQESSQEVSQESNSETGSSSGSEGIQASTEKELQSEIESAIENGASEEAVKQMIREFTLKVNGKEFIKKIDLNDEESLRKELQLAAAGRRAMQETAELKKLYNHEIGRLRETPTDVLRELGFSEDQLVELYATEIDKYLSNKQKPQEVIEAERRQKEYEEMKKKAEEYERRFKEKERQEQLSALEKEIETDIISTLDSDPDLPASPEVIAMVADNMIWAMSQGFEDVTASDVMPTVKKELQRKFRTVANQLKSPTALRALLGEDVLGKLREERLEQAKKVPNINELKQNVGSREEKVEVKKVPLSSLFK